MLTVTLSVIPSHENFLYRYLSVTWRRKLNICKTRVARGPKKRIAYNNQVQLGSLATPAYKITEILELLAWMSFQSCFGITLSAYCKCLLHSYKFIHNYPHFDLNNIWKVHLYSRLLWEEEMSGEERRNTVHQPSLQASHTIYILKQPCKKINQQRKLQLDTISFLRWRHICHESVWCWWESILGSIIWEASYS